MGDDRRMGVPAERLTQKDYEELAAFRYALRRFTAFSVGAAQSVGLTTNQHQALLALKGRGGSMTVGALATELLVAPHTAAELVGRLEDGGLVVKITDPADRRRVVIQLTEKAEAILRDLTLAHLREVRVLAPRLMAIFEELDAAGVAPSR